MFEWMFGIVSPTTTTLQHRLRHCQSSTHFHIYFSQFQASIRVFRLLLSPQPSRGHGVKISSCGRRFQASKTTCSSAFSQPTQRTEQHAAPVMRSSSVRVYHQVARTILGGHNSPTSTSPTSSAPVAVIRRRASSFCCSRSLSMSSSCSSISSIGASVASDPDSPVEHAKKAAAFACGDNYVKSGQKIGVGSGSTVKYFVQFLRERVRSGQLKDIQCVPTSFMTRRWLIEASLPVVDVEQCPRLDICIDGADEVDENLDLIKGGGGCLTQEKIVQSCADVFVVIADANKKSTALGDKYKVLPIEVVPVAYIPVQRWITEKFGGETHLRISSTKCSPLITDNNNYILEWHFPKDIPNRDWAAVHASLVGLPGVVETGLFVGVTSAVYFAEHDGSIEVRKR